MIIDLLKENEKKSIKTVSLKPGEVLFYENDVCDSVGVVIEGEVKISSLTYQGNEVIYNSLRKGSLFGNNLIFSKDNLYRGDVRSVTNSKIALIYKNELITLLQNNEEFLVNYLSLNSEFTRSLNSKIKLLTFTNAKERLLYYFYINSNRVVYKNITTLASQLYLSREVTSRLISSLEKKGKVRRNKHELILLDVSF